MVHNSKIVAITPCKITELRLQLVLIQRTFTRTSGDNSLKRLSRGSLYCKKNNEKPFTGTSLGGRIVKLESGRYTST